MGLFKKDGAVFRSGLTPHIGRDFRVNDSPMSRSRSDYEEIIGKISHPESPVGIDAQLTHAIIIVYLQQISERLERLEARLPDA